MKKSKEKKIKEYLVLLNLLVEDPKGLAEEHYDNISGMIKDKADLEKKADFVDRFVQGYLLYESLRIEEHKDWTEKKLDKAISYLKDPIRRDIATTNGSGIMANRQFLTSIYAFYTGKLNPPKRGCGGCNGGC